MSRLKNEKGLSLLEVLISISILFIILTAVAGIFIQAQKSTTINANKTIATFLAQGTIEKIKADPSGKGDTTLPPDMEESLKNKSLSSPNVFSNTSCEQISNDEICKAIYEPTVNGHDYKVEIHTFEPKLEEKNLQLIPFALYVFYNDNRSKIALEGYIQNE